MSIRPAYLYQLSQYRVPVAVYYIVVVIIAVILTILNLPGPHPTPGSSRAGFEGVTAIFLFITSLFVFREPLLMLMQNSVSRKSMFISRFYVTISISFILALIDKLVYLLEAAFWSAPGLTVYTFFEMAYIGAYNQTSAFLHQADTLIYHFLLYVAVIAAGYFIAIISYQTGKATKIAISVGAPVIFFVQRLVDYTFFDSRFADSFKNFFHNIFGMTMNSPHNAMLTFLVVFVVFTIFSWLMVRRVIVKNTVR